MPPTPTTAVQHFEPWIDPVSNVKAPLVLVGAGLSYGLAPTASGLAQDVAARQATIEANLGVVSSVVVTDEEVSLYRWADRCVQAMVARGETEAQAKTKLAAEMGVTSNPRFLAQGSIPERGTTARHRVIGRLAREGRVKALWSFNWDCWLEAALESVGLNPGERIGPKIAPWMLRYFVWLENNRSNECMDTVPLYKAHGCAKSFGTGNGGFVITESEMGKSLDQQLPIRIARMTEQLNSAWLVAIGWASREKYVEELVAKQKTTDSLGSKLTVININCLDGGLPELYRSYGTSEVESGVTVSPGSPGNTDDLFYWIQLRRGLAALRHATPNRASTHAAITAAETQHTTFVGVDFTTVWQSSFFDNWLPVWLRMCFLTRAQNLTTADGQSAVIFPIERRDSHIPWVTDTSPRHDLLATATVFEALSALTNINDWDFASFPGGLWHRSTRSVVLPVPIFAEIDGISSSGLRPLIESRAWEHRNRIERLAILPIVPTGQASPNPTELAARTTRWQECISASFSHEHLASAANIKVVGLAALGDADPLGRSP